MKRKKITGKYPLPTSSLDDRPIPDGEENLYSDPDELSPYEYFSKNKEKRSFDEKNREFY